MVVKLPVSLERERELCSIIYMIFKRKGLRTPKLTFGCVPLLREKPQTRGACEPGTDRCSCHDGRYAALQYGAHARPVCTVMGAPFECGRDIAALSPSPYASSQCVRQRHDSCVPSPVFRWLFIVGLHADYVYHLREISGVLGSRVQRTWLRKWRRLYDVVLRKSRSIGQEVHIHTLSPGW